jgi:hypothetical protein
VEPADPRPPANEGDEFLAPHLDRLEAALAHREAELCRLKTELDLRGLYIRELHDLLQAQAQTLTGLERRVRRMEEARAGSADRCPPVLIRIKKPG